MNDLTHKDWILRALYFQGRFTTELYMILSQSGVQIGVKSLTNRLTDLQSEGKIVGEVIEGRKEKFWKLRRYDKQQGVLL